ncbi:putative colanic acid biosysnthesis UDP-glucose lipid carrier transferase [Cyclobacterium lianum]|uniref:Putative colanic acid biosysnthesis UDP-glucose lipid carrier transferase n=1 Tax=Cyclobacterium lianum TaxID=388280 RepID=A0A1M7QT73_9BACT|nr:sugar transferase [Cyclobacterium lianum]SHN34635.1 putative colanic acid biosysnthesis UDP-glucose lipid carrier transferase [Cyclobacterium lianum]
MASTITERKPVTKSINTRGRFFKSFPDVFFDESQLFVKRSLDLVLSIGLVVFVFSWLFPIIGLLIKATSKGPVFFQQLRHGKDNVPFYCLKFRTMYLNDQADVKQATKNDPRVTWIGKFLRKSSMDELPQFFNVIKGDMSIVGPRPHAVPMNYKFSAEIDNFMFRHTVKPGITGLAQAKGFRGETRDFYDIYSRCKLDIFYVNNWSPFLDLKIIFWTIVSMLIDKDKAY